MEDYENDDNLSDDGSFCDDYFDEDAEMQEEDILAQGTPEPKQAYEVLCERNVYEYLEDTLKSVENVFGTPREQTRKLLCYHKWDVQKLMDAFYENQEKLFKDAGVIVCENDPMEGTSKQDKNECQICLTTFDSSVLKGLGCDHKYCDSCWKAYLMDAIKNIGVVKTIVCPGFKCKVIVDDDTVERFVTDPEYLSMYRKSITNILVKFNPCLKWCPAPNCNLAIKVDKVDALEVQCSCKHTFCFGCGKNAHMPIKCRFLEAWEDAKDSAASIYKKTFSKKCPKCDILIEKEEGCNHMTCVECKYEFCWICRGERDGYTRHYCLAQIDQVDTEEDDAKQEQDIIQLTKFNYYESLSTTHITLFEFEKEFLQKQTLDMQTRLKKEHGELLFMAKAADILLKCRQTLRHTYIFSYYVKSSNQSEIFEENQRSLQAEVEKLSSTLARQDVDITNFDQFRIEIENSYRFCERRRDQLLQHVQEGYDNNFWTWHTI